MQHNNYSFCLWEKLRIFQPYRWTISGTELIWDRVISNHVNKLLTSIIYSCRSNRITSIRKNDHIDDVDIWGEAKMEPLTTFLRQKRLIWCGHVLRKEGRKGVISPESG